MRASAAVVIAVLALASGGCKYISVLRRQGVDLTRRRQAVIVQEAEEIARELTVHSYEPDITDARGFAPRDLTDLDEAEAVEVVAAVLASAAKIKTAAARSDAWLRPMQTDLKPIPEEKRIELDSDTERDAHTSYCGLSDSKAYTLQWIRSGIDALAHIRRSLSWAYRAVKWTLIFAVAFFAPFGAVEWWKHRRKRAALRQAMDVIDVAKRTPGAFVIGEATAGKTALKTAWERDRAWRAGREGR